MVSRPRMSVSRLGMASHSSDVRPYRPRTAEA